MVLCGVFAYFLIVVAGVLLTVFPACRARLSGWWGTGRLAGGSAGPRSSRRARLAASSGWVGGGLVLLLPSLLVVLLRGPAIFALDDEGREPDRQIAILLEGEHLIPPPPLPPEIFTTREVEILRPDVVHASRNWQLLDPDFMQRLLLVFKLMQERHGYQMALIEGYRSAERQARLFAQGSHVTQARANMSYHQYGLAGDSAFLRDGKLLISERDPWAMRGYQLYGEIAEQVGLSWGGRWQMRDLGHVELRRKGVLGQVGAAQSPVLASSEGEPR